MISASLFPAMCSYMLQLESLKAMLTRESKSGPMKASQRLSVARGSPSISNSDSIWRPITGTDTNNHVGSTLGDNSISFTANRDSTYGSVRFLTGSAANVMADAAAASSSLVSRIFIRFHWDILGAVCDFALVSRPVAVMRDMNLCLLSCLL